MLFSLRRFIGVTLLFATTALGLRADMTPYVGRWQVDVPATMEASKQSPRYDPAQEEGMKKMITNLLGSMVLVIDKDTVSITRGGKIVESEAYTFKETRDGVTVVSVTSKNKAGELAFTTGEKRMRFKSSLSSAMDYYVWMPDTGKITVAPTPPPAPVPTIEANLETIWKAAETYSLINASQTVPYESLVKEKYFPPLKVSNGEDYATVTIDVKNRTVSVKDKDGVLHSYKKD